MATLTTIPKKGKKTVTDDVRVGLSSNRPPEQEPQYTIGVHDADHVLVSVHMGHTEFVNTIRRMATMAAKWTGQRPEDLVR